MSSEFSGRFDNSEKGDVSAHFQRMLGHQSVCEIKAQGRQKRCFSFYHGRVRVINIGQAVGIQKQENAVRGGLDDVVWSKMVGQLRFKITKASFRDWGNL